MSAMIGRFNVDIHYLDGESLRVDNVTHVRNREGVLGLYRRGEGGITLDETHLGSWPLQNIKFWKVTEL